jgi:hypothetical protein
MGISIFRNAAKSIPLGDGKACAKSALRNVPYPNNKIRYPHPTNQHTDA